MVLRRDAMRDGGELVAPSSPRNPSGNAHNPGLYMPATGGGRARMIETAFREECGTRLFGELVALSAAGEVRLFGQPLEGTVGFCVSGTGAL
jgi:ketol-acid reductoisomerase